MLLISADKDEPPLVEDVADLPNNGRRPAIGEEVEIDGIKYVVKDIGLQTIMKLKGIAIVEGRSVPDTTKVSEFV